MATADQLTRRAQNAWQPPPELLAAAQAAPWRGDPMPSITEQQPIGNGVVLLGRFVRANFPFVDQTYARGRDLVPGATPSMHHAGRAIDLMIPDVGGLPNRAGDQIADWLLANAREMGVQYFIWSGTQWSSATGRTSVYPGTDDHFGHIHVDMTNAGAAGLTPWFAQPNGPAPSLVLPVLIGLGAAAAIAWLLQQSPRPSR